MHAFRKLVAASAAAIVVMASGVPVAQADSTPPVYTTPGGQISDGRLWNTTCEKYSSSVVRCSTDIWATTVVYVKGSYVQKKGWVFNNLSYLPSARASWAINNLGRTNPNWTSEGRKWRTECDTATTGRGGCRSYIWAKTVRAVKSGSGYRYVNKNEWVFNNVVLFSSKSIPAVKKVPAWVIDSPGQWIEPQGLRWGPIRIGADAGDLGRLGYVRRVNPEGCAYWDTSQSLKNRGVRLEFIGNDLSQRLFFTTVDTDFIPTKAGARVGMTVGQVKALHGSDFRVVPKENYGSTQYFGSVREGAYELQFRVPGALVVQEDGNKFYEYAPTRPLVDTDVIAEIFAQRYTDEVSWEGC